MGLGRRGFRCRRLAIGAALVLLAAAAPEAAPQQAITDVLQQSARDWTRGDLDAFMRCYEDSPETEYIGAGGPVHGYAAIAARYRRRYGAPGQHFGTLVFSALEIRMLDASYALATGRFALHRAESDGGDASGIFTLLMHKAAQGWRISYDHTS